MLKQFATSYALKNCAFLILEVRWKQTRDRLAEDLIGSVPEKAFGSGVPWTCPGLVER